MAAGFAVDGAGRMGGIPQQYAGGAFGHTTPAQAFGSDLHRLARQAVQPVTDASWTRPDMGQYFPTPVTPQYVRPRFAEPESMRSGGSFDAYRSGPAAWQTPASASSSTLQFALPTAGTGLHAGRIAAVDNLVSAADGTAAPPPPPPPPPAASLPAAAPLSAPASSTSLGLVAVPAPTVMPYTGALESYLQLNEQVINAIHNEFEDIAALTKLAQERRAQYSTALLAHAGAAPRDVAVTALQLQVQELQHQLVQSRREAYEQSMRVGVLSHQLANEIQLTQDLIAQQSAVISALEAPLALADFPHSVGPSISADETTLSVASMPAAWPSDAPRPRSDSAHTSPPERSAPGSGRRRRSSADRFATSVMDDATSTGQRGRPVSGTFAPVDGGGRRYSTDSQSTADIVFRETDLAMERSASVSSTHTTESEVQAAPVQMRSMSNAPSQSVAPSGHSGSGFVSETAVSSGGPATLNRAPVMLGALRKPAGASENSGRTHVNMATLLSMAHRAQQGKSGQPAATAASNKPLIITSASFASSTTTATSTSAVAVPVVAIAEAVATPIVAASAVTVTATAASVTSVPAAAVDAPQRDVADTPMSPATVSKPTVKTTTGAPGAVPSVTPRSARFNSPATDEDDIGDEVVTEYDEFEDTKFPELAASPMRGPLPTIQETPRYPPTAGPSSGGAAAVAGPMTPKPQFAPGQVIESGWLWKCNPAGRFWKRRWCVLTDSRLAYYDSQEAANRRSQPKGTVPMEEARFQPGPGTVRNPKTKHSFTLVTPTREYCFCAEDSSVLRDWQVACAKLSPVAPA